MPNNRVKLATLVLAVFSGTIGLTHAAYDANWKKSQCDGYSSHGLYERYVFGASKGWIDNNTWDSSSTEGVDCSSFVNRCWAITGSIGEHTTASHGYATGDYYPGSVPNTVRLGSVANALRWDCFVWNDGSEGHMGLVFSVSASNVTTREAKGSDYGIISQSRSKQSIVDNGGHYYRRKDWGAETAPERIDVFVRGSGTPQIHQKYWPADPGWSDFIGMGGTPVGAPDACSFAPNRLDLFVRGTDNTLQHKVYNGTWSAWSSLGGEMASDPCAVSWGNNRIDVFYRSAAFSNQLVQVFWTSTGGWGGPVAMGGNLIGNPDACSWGANRIDIFGRGADNSLQHKYYNGTWSAWESLGGILSSDPGCTSWGANRIDVFVVGGTGPQVLQKIYNGSWDTNWYPMGGSPGGSPKVCSYESGRLDILMRGADNSLQHKYYDGLWSDWESLDGVLTADPGCVSWTSGN